MDKFFVIFCAFLSFTVRANRIDDNIAETNKTLNTIHLRREFYHGWTNKVLLPMIRQYSLLTESEYYKEEVENCASYLEEELDELIKKAIVARHNNHETCTRLNENVTDLLNWLIEAETNTSVINSPPPSFNNITIETDLKPILEEYIKDENWVVKQIEGKPDSQIDVRCEGWEQIFNNITIDIRECLKFLSTQSSSSAPSTTPKSTNN